MKLQNGLRCRVVPAWPYPESIQIDDFRWEIQDRESWLEIAMDIRFYIHQEVTKRVTLEGAPIASWLLARLWYLTDGALANGLNTDESGIGCQDAGYYDCALVVEDEKSEPLAIVHVTASYAYEGIKLLECSSRIDPSEVLSAIASTLCRDPRQVAICRIGIENPEERMRLYEYGWDGESFLGSESKATSPSI